MLKCDAVNVDDVERAAKVFHRDGFVTICGALTPSQLQVSQAACHRVIVNQTREVGAHEANRGFARYSFGDQLQNIEWANLAELPSMLRVLDAIFGDPNYSCSGAGGDYSLPGAKIQALHSDLGEFLNDPVGLVTVENLPPPFIVVNFLMVDFQQQNGAIRFVPGSQRRRGIPNLEDEPSWMREGIICAPAGTAIVRDVRCWHGGTENRSSETRAMMGIGYYASWRCPREDKVLPRQIFEGMSARGKQMCRHLVIQ